MPCGYAFTHYFDLWSRRKNSFPLVRMMICSHANILLCPKVMKTQVGRWTLKIWMITVTCSSADRATVRKTKCTMLPVKNRNNNLRVFEMKNFGGLKGLWTQAAFI